jgi:hypothetical protein
VICRGANYQGLEEAESGIAVKSCAESSSVTDHFIPGAVSMVAWIYKRRSACQLVGVYRSTYRYQPRLTVKIESLSCRIIELAQQRRWFGYRHIWHCYLEKAMRLIIRRSIGATQNRSSR